MMKTLTVDAHKRVRIPDARPGQVFAYEHNGNRVTLTEVKPVQEPPPANVRFEKRGRYTVGVLDRPIDEQALKQALEEFP
jgi:hypothetical protein